MANKTVANALFFVHAEVFLHFAQTQERVRFEFVGIVENVWKKF